MINMPFKSSPQDRMSEKAQVILQHYQSTRHSTNSLWRAILFICGLLFALYLLNISVGVVLYALNLSESITWHSASVIVLTLYLIVFMMNILVSHYQFNRHHLALAQWLDAREVKLEQVQLTAQEYLIYQLNQKVAQLFNITPVQLFVVNEQGINSFIYSPKQEQKQLFMTWGMCYHLSNKEIYQVLFAHYIMLLSGEARERSIYFIYLQGYIANHLYASRLMNRAVSNLSQSQYSVQNYIKLYIAGLIKLLSCVDFTLYRFIQAQMFQREHSLDVSIGLYEPNYIDTLLRIRLHQHSLVLKHDYLLGLSPLAFIQSYHGVFCSAYKRLATRIKQLTQYDVTSDALNMQHNIEQFRKQKIKNIFLISYYNRYFKNNLYKFDYQKNKIRWQNVYPLATQHQTSVAYDETMDYIRPLNPYQRQEQAKKYLNQVFPTKVHYIHVISYIFELRKSRSYVQVQKSNISASVVMRFYRAKLDGRLLLPMFEQCYQSLNIPQVVVKNHLLHWAEITQKEGRIHILDALMLERVKFYWRIVDEKIPQSLVQIMPEIMQVLDAIALIQPFQIPKAVKDKACRLVFGELFSIDIPRPEVIDYHQIFHKISGLNVQDRLKVLILVEYILWYHQKITQDTFDVIVLLYWRLGFNAEDIRQNLYKRHQISIW